MLYCTGMDTTERRTMDEYAHVRAAFREVALGLMEWAPPPREPWTLNRDRGKQTLYGHAQYVDPYDVDSDWSERA